MKIGRCLKASFHSIEPKYRTLCRSTDTDNSYYKFANYILAKNVIIASYRSLSLFLSLSLSLCLAHTLFFFATKSAVCLSLDHFVFSLFSRNLIFERTTHASCFVKNFNYFYFHFSSLFCHFSFGS